MRLPFDKVLWQSELVQDGLLVAEEFDQRDLGVILILNIDKPVVRDAPVRGWFEQWMLKGQLAVDCPDLEQVGDIVVLPENVLVDNLDHYRAKIGTLLVQATVEDLVELVEWHFVEHLADVFLGRGALILLQAHFRVLLLNLSQSGAFLSIVPAIFSLSAGFDSRL